ncbi:hypothetical protein PT974_09118 [Cladobotryum mycophilum]|uniref:Uncharacterized protein n=1 Tax=Cladobotryum mycophilum TaxID=491253 RepID=A0ABR0SFC2_9HYPO
MGNICGKTEDPDPFSQPGRVLGSAPPPGPKTAPVPKKVGGPPRTLGGGAAVGGASNPGEARSKAAQAAEARAKAASQGGKLQAQLSAQKKQTRTNTLAEASGQEVRARDADEAAKDPQTLGNTRSPSLNSKPNEWHIL